MKGGIALDVVIWALVGALLGYVLGRNHRSVAARWGVVAAFLLFLAGGIWKPVMGQLSCSGYGPTATVDPVTKLPFPLIPGAREKALAQCQEGILEFPLLTVLFVAMVFMGAWGFGYAKALGSPEPS